MDSRIWTNRIKSRNDFAARLTHLTRRTKDMSAFDVFIKILKEKELIGSTTETGYICGKIPAVCLQETPLVALAESIKYEKELNSDNPKYEAYGIRFNKKYVYDMGGRPVVYENKELMKTYLPEEEYWRIVNFDLTDRERIVDWTHEREWRVPNNLQFDYSNIEIIVPNSFARRELIKYCEENDMMEIIRDVYSIINMSSVMF